MSPSRLSGYQNRMEARIAPVLQEADWPPPISAAAMRGVAGNVVETIAPLRRAGKVDHLCSLKVATTRTAYGTATRR